MSKQILLVEDHEINRDMLVRRLTRAGYQVQTAGDGAAALAAMLKQPPDLVLMDMNLPVMDGWSACREARRNPDLRNIPIVALTAHAMDADRQTALAAGCDDYATKPIDFPALLDKIERLTLQ
jgi:two-component system, cell cycle response regulator DivK